MRARPIALLIALTVLAAGACKSKNADREEPNPEGELPKSVEGVSAEDAEAYATTLLQAFGACDVDALAQLIDVEAMVRRGTAGSNLSSAMREGVANGATGMTREVLGSFCSGLGAGTTFRGLGVRTLGDETSVMVRLTSDAGLNYIEAFIARSRGDAKIRAYDIYFYTAGQRLSDAFKDLFEAATSGGTSMSRAMRMRDEVQRIQAAMLGGDWQRAKQILDGLDPELRSVKSVMLTEMLITANISDEAYAETIERYSARYPDDPSRDLVSVDGYLMREQYDEALAAIARLDERVGGDPYLDVMRGSVILASGDPKAARAHFDEALAEEPDLVDAKWGLLDVVLAAEDFPAAASIMTDLRDNHGETFDPALAGLDIYAKFAASEEGKAFFAARPEPSPDAP